MTRGAITAILAVAVFVILAGGARPHYAVAVGCVFGGVWLMRHVDEPRK